MTAAMLGWFAAGVCLTAFIVLWFGISYRDLLVKRKSFELIEKQVQMHRKLYMQERGGPNDAAAKNVLKSKLLACKEAKDAYNQTLKTPLHRIPALMMGFRPVRTSELP